MPDWQAELSALLHALDVSLEHESIPDEDTSQVPLAEPDYDPAAEAESLDGAMLPADAASEQSAQEDDEVSAVRNEIEATLARVIHLTRAGQLDRTLRDDVVFVLQALTRPRPAPAPASDQEEWQLASAAAVLHFCRVVMRLTRSVTPEPGV